MREISCSGRAQGGGSAGFPAARALMGQKQKLTSVAELLVRKAGGGYAALRATLANLDQALEKNNQGLVLREIGRAVTLCKEVCPDQLERLKQHISVRALLAGAEVSRVTAAMGGPSLKNAYFWRLLARATRRTTRSAGDPAGLQRVGGVSKTAVHEKWFPASGPEVATLYLHMADLWQRMTTNSRTVCSGSRRTSRGMGPTTLASLPRSAR